MADIAGLRQKAGQAGEAEIAARERLRTATNAAQRQNFILPEQQQAYESARQAQRAAETEFQAAFEANIQAEGALADAEQTIGNAPRASAGQEVAQAQRANDDQANSVAPPAEAPPAPGVTNADQFDETPNTDINTDAATRSLTDTQSLPPITARPGPALGRIVPPNIPGQVTAAGDQSPQLADYLYRDDGAANTPTRQAGAGSPRDDQTGATGSGVRAALTQRFAGNIVPQGNVLDQYASYTYSISVYLMSATDYKQFITSPNALPGGSQLLIQSGGAATGGGLVAPSQADTINVGGSSVAIEDPGQVLANQVAKSNLTRNPFFSLDYYLDDVRIESVIAGKGVGQAHNVTKLQFRVIEPNGITFLDNLYKACDQYVRLSGSAQTNYAAQNYLMVIRFYGYDKDGNLVLSQNQPFLDPISRKRIDTVVEKFIPFQMTGIKFRVANKMVEYDVDCAAVPTAVAASAARGTIPYNVELTSQTLKDLLGGQAQFAKAPVDGQGRPGATPAADPGARNPANAGFLNTNESGTGTDFSLGVGA